MTENRSPLDHVLDLLVYAPLGLALTARDELPKLAEKGRSRVDTQLTMARMVGQFAVAQGRVEAEKLAERAAARVMGPPPPSPAPGLPAAPSPPGTAAASSPPRPVAPARSSSPPAGLGTISGNGHRPSADHLAIPGYDTLAASQVVQRLPGLSADELDAVRTYEEATRRRKTVLTRIEQLQSEA